MKKSFFFLAAVFVAALAFCSCSSDSATDTPDGDLAAAKLAIKSKLAGCTLLDESPISNGPSIQQESFHWENAVDIINTFPEFVTPKGVYHDFTFTSTGKPFDLVMLYANGGYRHKLYIYWYDKNTNEFHDAIVWDEHNEKESGSEQTWYNANGQKSDIISRKSDKAGAYKIQLPKGTKFGFYQESYYNGELVEIDYKGEKKPYRFYTEWSKNWNREAITDEPMGQAMTTAINNWTIVGFEDVSRNYPSCDKDYNDVVFAINPVQKTDPDPDPVIVDGSVETNISVTGENGTDKVKLSVHVRAVTDFEVIIPVTDEVLADDFAIVAKHDVEYVYSEPIVIAGETVKLNYSLTEEGYLKISSEGINEKVIEYCKNKYADGLTFESYLFYGKFDLKAKPTITFTKNPTFYITSCVTNSPEAKDIEVVWDEDAIYAIEQLDFTTTGGKLIYDHKVYSPYDVEKLKEMGWIKEKKETTPTE